MALINTTTTQTSRNPYETYGERVANRSSDSVVDNSGEKDKPSVIGGVKVSLSKDVKSARLRESLGLSPTGRITKGDFEKIADSKEKTISSKLDEIMKKLGIDKDQKISLSFNSKSEISISESFNGKSKLMKALNSDDEFKTDFRQLTSNRQVVDFAHKLVINTPSIGDFMNEETSMESLLSIADRYNEIKSGVNSLTGLLGISRSETPYTYVHGSMDSDAKGSVFEKSSAKTF